MADFSSNETLNTYFELDDQPTVDQMQAFIKSKVGILLATGDLPTAASTNLGHKYLIGTTLYTCILTDTTYSWQAQVWGGGVSAYTDLSAKPKINSIELNGDKTALQLGLLPTATTGMTSATTLGVDNIFLTKAGTTWYYVPFSLLQSLILSGSAPIFLSGTAVTGTSSGVIVTVAGSKINDMYINTTTGNLYQCVDVNTWNFICTLVPTKTEMFFGTEVTGTGTDISATVENSKAGDYYKNTSTSLYYQATAANVWDYMGSDKGVKGDDGDLDISTLSMLSLPVQVSDLALVIREGVLYKVNMSDVKTFMNAE